MSVLVVLENPENCPLNLEGINPVAARTYLTDSSFATLKGVKVFNICKSYRYQSIGYYVSLLAEARGHKSIPGTTTILDMKSVGIIRLVSDEFENRMAKCLGPDTETKLSIHIYFGKTREKKYTSLGSALFKAFPTPFLRADFSRTGSWQLQNVTPLSVQDIPVEDRIFVENIAQDFFGGRKLTISRRTVPKWDLALLRNPNETRPPSDAKALRMFTRAAESLGFGVETISREDSNRLSAFDALFIRETTNVNHHTYRISRKATAEGLVVLDDPVSIMRCSNKVYLAELLSRNRIPTPRTLILHNKNIDQALAMFNLPCILKQPDSSFSQGVIMVRERTRLIEEARRMLKKSDLVIAQEFVPTDFDWRIGVLDGKPLYACKYHMARKHWQIISKNKKGQDIYGKVETFPEEKVPRKVIQTALRAAKLIGDGLYGVDLKQRGKDVVVIEVNDNPNIDSGIEDLILGEELYLRIASTFLNRIEDRIRGERSV
ncbi:RimK family protein [Desulforhopalus singaporensis]|uniref:Glutathione synthase/RimK-type ligase, ATP-grasp superfamily n=1 Tax=Desulforhopalus singaporensis TaxID=91360 RepID=A0A1H0LVA1_9BACT|nr:RimK family protein [Desulforhopalus singaporensis]SDO71866.1 Glutathione synthase/RimK-type ligase, ATP-grasp superfamily [Desulforhopalus singaporensis]